MEVSEVERVGGFLQVPKIREAKKELIAAHIARIAKIYGASKDIGEVIAECVRIAKKKFPFLAPDEIREAYESWAVNPEIERSAEMYGGKLNALNFGRVLSAYAERRNKIAAAIRNERDRQREEAEEEKRHERMKRKFNQDFVETLRRLKENTNDWRDIPEYIYRVLRNRGELPGLNERWPEIWEDARRLAELEIKNREEEKKLGKHFFIDSDFETIRIRIARKIAVFRLVVKQD